MAEAAGRTVHTHCLICEQLCGLDVTVEGERIIAIRPDKANPYTWRDFCVKGQRSHEVASHPLRLRSPMRRAGDRWVEASYDEAIDDVSTQLRRIIAAHGVDAVGGYMGNPMGFSFGAASFHAGFLAALGSHQRYSVQSIDSNAKHVAQGAMFGVEMLALLPDIDATDCALLIGTNPAVSKFNWGGKVPDGWRRLKDRVRAGAELIVVDPRATETAVHATRHLAPHPEGDWALLLGMVKVIVAEGLVRLPPEVPVNGLAALETLAASVSLERLAAICGVPADDIEAAALVFGRVERAFAFAGTGPALGRHGVIAHWLTLALNVLTNRLDRPGGRFMPAWPGDNAARALGAKPDPTLRPSHVRRLAPVVGLHALAELADEITIPGEGQIRALILGGGNPVSTGPDGDRLDRALGELELLVAIDLFQRESHRHADWLIPAVHFLEREEVAVPLHAYNDQPFVQASRQVVAPPPGVRPEWTFYRDLADALGIAPFGGAMRDPDALADAMLGAAGLDVAQVRAAPHGLLYGERTMGHLLATLPAFGRAIELCPRAFAEAFRTALTESEDVARDPDAFRMISRRRTGTMNSSVGSRAARSRDDEIAEAAEINVDDAALLGLVEGDRAEIRSEAGAIVVPIHLSTAVRRGAIVLAHGLGSPLRDPVAGSSPAPDANQRNKLVADRDVDRLSGVPRLNGFPVRLRKVTSEPAFPSVA